MRLDLNTYYEEDSGAGTGGTGEIVPQPEQQQQQQPDPQTDPFDDPNVDKFDRAYVERLRKEAGDHRVAAKQFKDAFDGYEDDEVAALLDLVQTIQRDPRTAASRMADLVEAINESYKEPEPQQQQQEEKPLTQQDLVRLLEEREREAAIDKGVKEIEEKATALGYKPDSDQYVRLLWLTQNKTNFDMDAAHKIIEDEKQALIDAYIASKKNEPIPVLGGEGGTNEPSKPGGFDSARARLEARLNAVAGQ